jgi:hypothetical protein
VCFGNVIFEKTKAERREGKRATENQEGLKLGNTKSAGDTFAFALALGLAAAFGAGSGSSGPAFNNGNWNASSLNQREEFVQVHMKIMHSMASFMSFPLLM